MENRALMALAACKQPEGSVLRCSYVCNNYLTVTALIESVTADRAARVVLPAL